MERKKIYKRFIAVMLGFILAFSSFLFLMLTAKAVDSYKDMSMADGFEAYWDELDHPNDGEKCDEVLSEDYHTCRYTGYASNNADTGKDYRGGSFLLYYCLDNSTEGTAETSVCYNKELDYRKQCGQLVANKCEKFKTCNIDTKSFDDWFNNSGNYSNNQSAKDYLKNGGNGNYENCTKIGNFGLDKVIGTANLCNYNGELIKKYAEQTGIDYKSLDPYALDCYVTECNNLYTNICEKSFEASYKAQCDFNAIKNTFEQYYQDEYVSKSSQKYQRLDLYHNISDQCTAYAGKYYGGNTTVGGSYDCALNYCRTHFDLNTLNQKYVEWRVSAFLNPEGTTTETITYNFNNLTCEDIQGMLTFFDNAYTTIEIAAVIIVVIMSMIDFMGVISNGEEADEKMKKAKKHLITRIIILFILFLLPSIINITVKNFVYQDSSNQVSVTPCTIK